MNYASRVTILLLLVTVVFSPFAQFGKIPIAQAVTKAECDSRGGQFSFDSNGEGVCGTKGANITDGITRAQGASDFGCSFIADGGVGKNFALCIASIVYYIGPGLASNIAYVGAYLFSYTVSLSLNSVAYALDFLSEGWTTVRDLANMAFILILVYIAFMIMFQAETTGTIRMLAWVIFIALIINFSFFLTRVVIDSGNILAVQFYNAIPQTPASTLNGTTGLTAFGGSGVKDLSYSIMEAVGLQSLFNTASFDAAQKAAGDSVTGGLIVLSLVYLSVAVMFWMLFFVFLQVGIKFLMRIVVLWFLIMAAPLAFVAKAVPRDSVRKYYDTWQSYLIKFSFYPAIFLFIYLLIIKFVQQMLSSQSGNLISTIFNGQTTQAALGASQSSAGFAVAGAIANVSIRMGFVIAMFYIALKASDWIVQEGSNAAYNLTGRLTGAALGTAAFAGRVGLGGVIGGTIARQPRLAEGGILARGLWNTGRFLNKGTYDVRNLPGTKGGLGLLGGDLVKGRTLDVGKGHTQTARDVEKNVAGFVDWARNGPSEAAQKDRKELRDRVTDINKREGIKKLVKIEKNWTKDDEAMLKTLQGNVQKGIKLDPPAQDKLAQLEKTSKERSDLIKNARSYNPDKLALLGTKDLKAVMQHLTEAQRKAIENSNALPEYVKADLKKQWHETSKDAPLVKANRELEELGKIHDKLSDIGVSLGKMQNLNKYSKPSTTVEITEDVAKAIKKETENLKKEHEEGKKDAAEKRKEHRESVRELQKEIEELNDLKGDMRRSEAERQTDETKLKTKEKLLEEAKRDLAIEEVTFKKMNDAVEKLDDAIKRSDTLASNTKEVPESVGGHPEEGKFTRSA